MKEHYISKLEVLASALMEYEEQNKSRVWANLKEVPVMSVKQTVISEANLKTYWGRKWKKTLENVVKLGIKAEEMTHIEGCYREASISCTNPKIKKALGIKSQVSLAKAIDDAVNVGLLLMTDDEYKIGKCGRKFVCNTPVLNQLTAMLPNGHETLAGLSALNSTLTPTPSIMFQYSDDDEFEDEEGEIIEVRDWTIQHGFNTKATDEEVLRGIYKHYPWLREYQQKVEELNKVLPQLFKMKFNPSVKRNSSNRVIKVGIRCTSDFCSSDSETRKNFLAKQWGIDKIYDYDVKSSIYRVTYFLNNGVWLNDDVDLYIQMIEKGGVPMSRKTFKNMIAMGMYFGKSEKQSLNWFARKLRFIGKPAMSDSDKEEYYGIWRGMREVVGKSYSSEIFLHESCIYIDLLEELIKRGFRVGQVYDGFYSDRPIEDVCEELLPVLAEKYAIKAGFKEEEEPKAEEPKTEKIEIPYQSDVEMENNKTAEALIDDLFADEEDVKTEEEVKTKTQPTPLTEEELDALLDSFDLAPYEQKSTDKCDNTWQHARYIDEAHRREAEINRGKREFMMW